MDFHVKNIYSFHVKIILQTEALNQSDVMWPNKQKWAAQICARIYFQITIQIKQYNTELSKVPDSTI